MRKQLEDLIVLSLRNQKTGELAKVQNLSAFLKSKSSYRQIEAHVVQNMIPQ